MEVQLDDVVAGAAAGVGDLHRSRDRSVDGNFGAVERQVAVGEGGVTQAVPERVLRFAIEIHVGEAFGDVVFGHRR